MNAELVREIAERIVRNEILLNWHFYLLIIALGAIGSAAGAWLSSYMKKRAETYATKADMQEVLAQVAATTRATEEVRTAISHSDWMNREWKAIRRVKLEELLSAVYSLDRWLDEQQSRWIYQTVGDYQLAPLNTINVLGSLYFPSLTAEIRAVVFTHQAALSTVLDTGRKTSAAQQDVVRYKAALAEHVVLWGPLYLAAQLAIAALESRAVAVMHEIAGALYLPSEPSER